MQVKGLFVRESNLQRRRAVGYGVGAAIIAGAPLLGGPVVAQSQPWPGKTVQLLVGAPAGGAVDTTARKLSELFPSAVAGGTMIVQNRPGAAGLLQAQLLASAAPDGYTLGYLHSGHVILHAMEGKPNMLADFTPVTMFSSSQFCIGVSADSPYRSLDDLFSAIEREPGRFNYGAGGNGSPGHIAWEKVVALRTKLQVTQVPFKGAIEAVMAVAQKNIDFVCGVLPSVLSVAKTGKIRILAVTGRKRSTADANIPTVAEAARLPGYFHESWGAVYGPAGMPPAVVSAIDTSIRKIATDPAFLKFLHEQGGEPALSENPVALAKFVETEVRESIALMTRLGLRKA